GVVDYGDIWFGLQRLLNRLLPVSGLSHHLPVRLSLNDMAQSRSDHIVVVCDQDSDHRGKLRRALTKPQGFPPPATATNPDVDKFSYPMRGSSHPGQRCITKHVTPKTRSEGNCWVSLDGRMDRLTTDQS